MDILTTHNLRLYFAQRQRVIKALDGVDIFLKEGLTTSLAGESGCGKTTLAKAILGFYKPQAGEIKFKGREITQKENEPLIRRNIQIVFQNPFLSLDPCYTVFATLYETLSAQQRIKKSKARRLIEGALREVELEPSVFSRYPHQLSGGQLQRVCIARALINKPSLVLLDEPTSSLDIITSAKIIDLLRRLQEQLGITFLFISHNLKLLKKISQFCFIMYQGKIVEYGPKEAIYSNPTHPYTKMLLAAAYQRLNPKFAIGNDVHI